MTSPAVFPGELRGLSPIYPLTAGLTSRGIAKDAATALAALPAFPEPYPDWVRQQNGVCTLDYALRTIHSPRSRINSFMIHNRLSPHTLCILLSSLPCKCGKIIFLERRKGQACQKP